MSSDKQALRVAIIGAGKGREHLDAYRELTALVHGQYIAGTTSVKDLILQDNSFQGAVAGIIRGARVVKSYPVQTDVYATILEVDLNQLQQAWDASN